jgi:predicted ester cyclase
MGDGLIRQYYDCFNQRRFHDGVSLFARDAVVEHPPFRHAQQGSEAFLEFAAMWVEAFPDGQLRIDQVEQRGDTICEVNLVATGTHQGTLKLGAYGVFKPTHAQLNLRLRQLFEVRFERITLSSLSIDVQGLVRQLARVDFPALIESLDRLTELRVAMVEAGSDQRVLSDLADRLGAELDTARHALRPHFARVEAAPGRPSYLRSMEFSGRR